MASRIPGGGSVTLNRSGMRELLRSPEIQNMLSGRMERVKAAVPRSQLEVSAGGNRARAKVINGSDYDEANTGDLSRALDLAGGDRGTQVKTRKPKPRT
jgi:hypothetical protein